MTRARPPPGYYRALNEGEIATVAIQDLFETEESDYADK
jgi:hypothetical protein